jgi:hypothetical protein
LSQEMLDSIAESMTADASAQEYLENLFQPDPGLPGPQKACVSEQIFVDYLMCLLFVCVTEYVVDIEDGDGEDAADDGMRDEAVVTHPPSLAHLPPAAAASTATASAAPVEAAAGDDDLLLFDSAAAVSAAPVEAAAGDDDLLLFDDDALMDQLVADLHKNP